jgi:hypothetical protein
MTDSKSLILFKFADYIRFAVDDVEMGRIDPGPGGFWDFGGFAEAAPGIDNPWRYGSKMAPFDQQVCEQNPHDLFNFYNH